jgi:endonuclease YncB( thermonuclease family)
MRAHFGLLAFSTSRSVIAAAVSTLAAFASLAPAKAVEIEVISGDAFRLGAAEWRIANIDAPQIEGTCQAEMKLGLIAQAKLAEFLAQGELEIAPTGERDLRRRAMAQVRINGEDVGEKMLAANLAQRHGYARSLCRPSGLADYQRFGHPQSWMYPRRGIKP